MGDTYTGPKQVRFVELQQATSSDQMKLSRLPGRYIQRVLRTLLADQDGVPQNGVLDGFAVTAAASLSLAVDVSAGLAFVDNATGLDAPTLDPRYRVLELETGEEDVTFDAADATHPRIDAIYVAWANDTSVEESRNIRATPGGSPSAQNTDTIIGPAPTIGIAKGTAASSPAAPSIPSNSIRLANVTIPATATASGSLTVTDTRPMLPIPARPGTLAGGTEVDGSLTATGALNAAAVTSSGIATVGTNLDVAGSTVSGDLRLDSQNDTAAAIVTRYGATGTPDAADDSVVVEVERGDSTNAGMRWDEGDDAWQASRGTALGYQGLLLAGRYNSGADNTSQMAIWSEIITETFAGGAAEETFNGSINSNNILNTGGQYMGVAVISSTGGTSAAKAVLRIANCGPTGYSITVRTHDGSNFTASDTITFHAIVIGKANG